MIPLRMPRQHASGIENDSRLAALRPQPESLATGQERAFGVHIHYCVPCFGRALVQGSISERTSADTGNIHKSVNPAESFQACGHSARDRGLIPNVHKRESRGRQLALKSAAFFFV
jgi:hypothetical protein